jgi:hypothetical protein
MTCFASKRTDVKFGSANVAAWDGRKPLGSIQTLIIRQDYFSGRCGDGYSDYRGAEPVLRREFARSVDFFRRFSPQGGEPKPFA